VYNTEINKCVLVHERIIIVAWLQVIYF